MKFDRKLEYEQYIAAIDRNKEFWNRHIPLLREHGCTPSQEQIEWVDKHVQGLEESRIQLESFLKTYYGGGK